MAMKVAVALALFGASAVAQTAAGSAIVINNCNFAVSLNNVPAADEGGQEESKVLETGDTYSQHYTGLSGHHDGWSIKLQPANSPDANGIMQYEYTYQPTNGAWANFVWFDMSYVNGDPFNHNWKFSSTNPICDALLTALAYEYPTDDAKGMQKPCTPDDDVTLTLCPSTGSWGGMSSSSAGWGPSSSQGWSSSPASTSTVAPPAPTTSTVAPPSSSTMTTSIFTPPAAPSIPIPSIPGNSNPHSFGFGNHAVQNDDVDIPTTTVPTEAPTTLSKSYVTAGRTVMEIETEWVTQFITLDVPAPTEAVHKRHEHHGAHHHHA